jgi:hypothetical protein
MSKEKKTTKKTCKHYKERTKEKAPPKKITLALKRAVTRSKHWFIASVVIGYFALTYEGLVYSYSAYACIHYFYSKK